MGTKSLTNPASPTRTVKRVSWGLRILASILFLAAGGAKLAGVSMLVAIFDHIGIGQWFRVATGLVEIAGSIALLVPETAGLGAALLSTTMVFAVLTHLLVIGGNPIPATVLLVITMTIAFLHRAEIAARLNRLS